MSGHESRITGLPVASFRPGYASCAVGADPVRPGSRTQAIALDHPTGITVWHSKSQALTMCVRFPHVEYRNGKIGHTDEAGSTRWHASNPILNYCRTKVSFGVVEAINGNIKTLLRKGRGYKNLGYLLLKAQRRAVTKTEFIVL